MDIIVEIREATADEKGYTIAVQYKTTTEALLDNAKMKIFKKWVKAGVGKVKEFRRQKRVEMLEERKCAELFEDFGDASHGKEKVNAIIERKVYNEKKRSFDKIPVKPFGKG